METAAIIVAAGRGTRAGSSVPKQYRRIGGLPVLTHALRGFVSHDKVEMVLTVIHAEDTAEFRAASAYCGAKLLDPVTGGDTRQDSVRAGLERLAEHAPRNVLIHDAARPFADAALIGRVIDALDKNEGAIPALPVTDTLKQARDGMVGATIDRSGLWRAQTPQGFRYARLLEAHEGAMRAKRTDFTDDSSLAEWHGLGVALVEGAEENVKLTTDEDFRLAECRFAGMGEYRTGQGFDVHAFSPGRHVMLCGVRIPHDKTLSGHSDADVSLHALTDALLGAIGDGDIGAHFPPDDPEWKGAASDAFLRDAAERVAARGGAIVNVDVTLICEAPKLGPHREAMRARIAEILGIEPGRVSVKATTTEGLGFTGRGEGIAAQATATVKLG